MEIRTTKEKAIERQAICPDWMRELKDGEEYDFTIAEYPFGTYWLAATEIKKVKQ